MGAYDTGLDKNPANYQPLTPLTYLERAAATFPDHTAIIHGEMRVPYRDFYARSRRLASALAARGVRAKATRCRRCCSTRRRSWRRIMASRCSARR
jgi:fatty-acyl-CoA synthase